MEQTMKEVKLSISELEREAVEVRCRILEMIHEAQAGHPGGSLSAADIVTALYFRMMRLDPANPQWPDRDRFILSKGHACPVWYAALAERGFYDKSHLMTLRKLNSILQGHADMITRILWPVCCFHSEPAILEHGPAKGLKISGEGVPAVGKFYVEGYLAPVTDYLNAFIPGSSCYQFRTAE